ncbi:uncharacterized protein PGRI_089650 [Penicillium griseofulvum]|uniref:Uncharacterized protein n=1 Tax=Penicillium patulum TaxID=5078 RepID=A0A135LRL0_PENPA|nr:uncharacterized protein PGRI_089650 [Penicillium griseofulvum]KXG51572.1 hypothetical protein PGRI_089650 [Penicillium griseofulvum]
MAFLPDSQRSWLKRIETAKLQTTKTIHSFESAASGSKITLQQFLLLRVLWVKNEANELSDLSKLSKWNIPQQNIEAARKHLKALPNWVQYISTISKNLSWHQEKGFSSLGTFSLVRLYQLNSKSLDISQRLFIPKLEFSPMRTRSHGLAGSAQARDGNPVTPTRSKKKATASDYSSLVDEATADFEGIHIDDDESPESLLHISPFSPPTGDLGPAFKSISDEQIVNTALLLYLQALLINICEIGADWTPERRALVVKKKDGQKVYEARVDGFLRYQHDENSPIMAIVEVKPSIREQTLETDAIRMQEGAQMAAWISQHPPTPSELTPGGIFSRLLVSQDRHQIYLTFAEFDTDYVHYICDTTSSPKLSTPLGKKPSTPPSQIPPPKLSFLKMNEYGPFDIGIESHMSSLGQIVLAFSCRACEIRKKALSKAQRQK